MPNKSSFINSVIAAAISFDAPVSPIKVGAAYGKGSITPSVIVILSGADRAVVVKLMKIKT